MARGATKRRRARRQYACRALFHFAYQAAKMGVPDGRAWAGAFLLFSNRIAAKGTKL